MSGSIEMMIVIAAVALALGALAIVLLVRPSDLPPPEPVSPVAHLEQRRKTVYDNLRDLQFEYRLGKLSDGDYQEAKKLLQQELAELTAAIEGSRTDAGGSRVQVPASPAAAAASATPARPNESAATVCSHCGARFPQPLKFCGECGRPMKRGSG
ncbi:MAG: hypothetical protein ACUVXB_03125 [Bryobacteraceae bacterium]